MTKQRNNLMPSTGLRLVMPLCAGLAGGLLPEASRAQSADTSQIEEIVVTAQKTDSTVQKTPISMTALTSADLDKSLTQSIKDLGTSVPNVSIGQTTAYAMIYIRGIGTNNVGNGSDPDVTVQLDGIYLARPVELFNDFTDVERVEVLRGPQGTLYGRNAVGGTINIISKTPSDMFSATEALTYGNYNTVQEQGYVTGPIVPDKLQFSMAFNYLHHDPYLKNLDPAGNDLQNANHGGIHGQLQWEPSANVTATTRFDWMLLGENPASFSVPNGSIPEAPLANSLVGANNFKVAQNTPDYQSEAGGGISEDINATINQHWSLRSLTAFRENHLHQAFDGDNTEIPASTFNQADKENQATQEFDLNWHYNRFKGVTGIYYFHEYISTFVNQSLAPAAGYPGSPPVALSFQATPVTNAGAGAAFTQGTFDLTDHLSFTAGLRYTIESKTLHQNFTVFEDGPPPVTLPTYPFIGHTTRKFYGATPKFGLDWQVTPSDLLYFSATKGYKSGGMNFAATTPSAESFSPETIWSYEIGAKTDWFDKRLRFNLAGFLYDYKKLQVQTELSPGVLSIGNAATATGKGVEAEITAKPAPEWRITFNATALSAKYSSFPDAVVASGETSYLVGNPNYNAATGTFNAAGKSLNQAPKFTAFVAAERDWDIHAGTISARAEYSWTGRVFYDPTNIEALSQGAYGIVNAFLGFDTVDGKWTAQLYGKNLTDKEYFVTMAAEGAFPSGLVGSPRTFGARLGYHF